MSKLTETTNWVRRSEVGDGGGDEKVSEWDEWRSIGPSSLIPLSTDSGQGLKSTESMVQTNGE